MVQSAMPRVLRVRLAGHLNSLTHAGASPTEVLKRVSPLLEKLELEREQKALGSVAHNGVFGLGPTLEALQQGRIQELAFPARQDHRICLDPGTGHVSAPAFDRLPACPSPCEERSLRSLLPQLTDTFATRVSFHRGGNERFLVDELGGLGGLTRW